MAKLTTAEIETLENLLAENDELRATILAAWQVIDHNCQAYKILSAQIRQSKS